MEPVAKFAEAAVSYLFGLVSDSEFSTTPVPGVDCIYVLQLSHGCYYVGRTADVDQRYAQHLGGQGPKWTQLHPPLRLVEVCEVVTQFDEDNKVKELMLRHGVDKVRGGSYAAVDLSDNRLAALNAELNTARQTCFKCGQPGHYVRDCPRSSSSSDTARYDRPLHAQDSYEHFGDLRCGNCGSRSHVDAECQRSRQSVRRHRFHAPGCAQCGRFSHTAIDCYAKSHQDGGDLKCARCGRRNHATVECYARMHQDGGEVKCTLCGRRTHEADDCYAQTHVTGPSL